MRTPKNEEDLIACIPVDYLEKTKKTTTTMVWNNINEQPDIIIFEGWCVGARAEINKTLKKPINSLEKTNDQNLMDKLISHKNKIANESRKKDKLINKDN